MQTVKILENKFEQLLMTANVHVFHYKSQRTVAWTKQIEVKHEH